MRLPDDLLNNDLFPHVRDMTNVLETHISWVALDGSHAFKFKKSLVTPYLDYRTLEQRKQACAEELRLNKRMAPRIYEDVIAITQDEAGLRINGAGPAVEYAVKMHRFPADALLEQQLAAGRLTAAHLRQAARAISQLHQSAAIAPVTSDWGQPDLVRQQAVENFTELTEFARRLPLEHLSELQEWTNRVGAELQECFVSRVKDGMIRECHGDLHLRNLVLFQDEVCPFDGIEFNEGLRWIDVMSDLAFLLMDLQDHRRPDLASIVLNEYLEITGDYLGCRVLRWYEVYRSVVRAKVCALQAMQGLGTHQANSSQIDFVRQANEYLALAKKIATPVKPNLIVTHGLSGSGKTRGTQQLIESKQVVRIRSDVERKRLFGLSASADSESVVRGGIYSPEASAITYGRLRTLAAAVIGGGRSVVVDAACLCKADRDGFSRLATDLGIRLYWLPFAAEPEELKARIETRRNASIQDASEATPAVLEQQLRTYEPLTTAERQHAISLPDLMSQIL